MIFYTTLSQNYSQIMKLFCINYLKDSLKNENDSLNILNLLLKLKINGTNEFFRNDCDELIAYIKNIVDQTNNPIILIASYFFFDLIIQSLNNHKFNFSNKRLVIKS